MSEQAIRMYELGKRDPSSAVIEEIGKALDVAPESLRGIEINSACEALELLFALDEKYGLTPYMRVEVYHSSIENHWKEKGSMKRSAKGLAIVLLAAFICFALTGCGGDSGSSGTSDTSTSDSSAGGSVEQGASGPVALPLDDSTSVTVKDDYTLTRPVYKEDGSLKPDEFCLSDHLSQASLDEGWSYYYTDSEDDIVSYLDWQSPSDCYAARITVLYGNLKKEPVDISGRIKGSVIIDAGTADEKQIDCTLFQVNPRQADKDGNTVANTKVFDGVESGETVQFGFFVGIPRADLDSSKPMMLQFSIDDAQYEIDLQAELDDGL